jgi:hypothetical protein
MVEDKARPQRRGSAVADPMIGAHQCR